MVDDDVEGMVDDDVGSILEALSGQFELHRSNSKYHEQREVPDDVVIPDHQSKSSETGQLLVEQRQDNHCYCTISQNFLQRDSKEQMPKPLFETLDMAKDNEGNGISRLNFKNGQCHLAFDFTPDEDDSGHWDLIRDGSTSIELMFADRIPYAGIETRSRTTEGWINYLANSTIRPFCRVLEHNDELKLTVSNSKFD
uniref:Uncharacterized protein n=1 Tax=Romanomermis culicivorax TaxID=13658 RepID=A0A915I2N4_ROMCU